MKILLAKNQDDYGGYLSSNASLIVPYKHTYLFITTTMCFGKDLGSS